MLKRWKPVESIDALGGEGVIAGELSGDPAVPDGLLTVNGVPTSREIEVRDRKTRRVVSVRRSNADGTYRFPGLNPALQYDVIARDYAGEYEDVIAGAVRPHTPDQLIPVVSGEKMAGLSEPYAANVVALLRFDDLNFIDETGRVWVPYGNAVIDAEDSKFGNACGLFDGVGDYISAPSARALYLEGGDFTIETWYRATAIGTRQFLCGSGNAGADVVRCLLEITAAGQFRFATGDINTAVIVFGTTVLTVGNWVHLAATRQGTKWCVFVNGFKEGEVVSSAAFSDIGLEFVIGRCGQYAGFTTNGRLDEFRITKGVARYTANFAPPTAPFEL